MLPSWLYNNELYRIGDNDIVLVRLSVKVSKRMNETSKLHVVVTLGNKKTGVMVTAPYLKGQVSVARPVFNISVPQLIGTINDNNGDFLQYLPNERLTEKLIAAKIKAMN